MLHRAVDLMDTNRTWELQWFRLVESQEGVGRFLPAEVHVAAFTADGLQSQQVWPPRRRRGARGFGLPRGARLVEATDADDDGDDGEGIGAADGGADGAIDQVDERPEPLDALMDTFAAAAADVATERVVNADAAEFEGIAGGPQGSPDDAAAQAASSDVAPRPRAHGLPRGRAQASVLLEGGRLSYYESKSAYQAVCGNAAHGRCVLTRSRKSRPLGLLSAWLAQSGVDTKEQHWSDDCLRPSLEDRRTHRQLLAVYDGAEELFAYEGYEGSIDSEPENIR